MSLRPGDICLELLGRGSGLKVGAFAGSHRKSAGIAIRGLSRCPVPIADVITSAPVNPERVEVTMSKIKVLLLSVLAVFAVSAIASASASALVWEACLESSGTHTKYEDSHCKKELSTGKFEWMAIEEALAVTSSGGEQLLEIPSAGIKITCSALTSEGEIKTEGKDFAKKLLYTGCKINIAGCEVVKTAGKANKEIEVVNLNTELSTLTLSGKLLTVDLFVPKEPPTFVVLEIGQKEKEGKAEKACGVLAVKDEVKGSVTGMVEGQKLAFTGEGSLTTDGLASEYKGEDNQVLTNGKLFRASN
jgi:hypothetical protein